MTPEMSLRRSVIVFPGGVSEVAEEVAGVGGDTGALGLDPAEKQVAVIMFLGSRYALLRDEKAHLSKAAGAIATTTTRLATIKAVATPVTMMIEPREAGNLPRIT